MAESVKAKKSGELTEKQERFRRFLAQGAREGAVIALIALCIYLGMALVTFSPSDPGWASIGHDTSVQNYAGRTGAWLASLLRDFFGHVAFLFPVMIAGYALMLIRRRNDPIDMHMPLFLLRFGGFLLILLSATSLLSLYSVFGLGVTSGGVLGSAVSEAMVRFFNLPATTLLLIAIFLFALTVSTGMSWFWLMDQVGNLTLRIGNAIKNLFSSSDKEKPKPAAKAPAAPEPAKKPAEPPTVRDRVATQKTPAAGNSWWRRLLRLGPRAEKVKAPASRPERKEPGLEGVLPVDDAEPARLESFSSQDDTTPVAKPSPKGNSKPPGKSLKISPFKRDDQSAGSTNGAKSKQASLLEDIESTIPPITLLDPPEEHKERGYSEESLQHMSRLLEEKLADFGVSVEVVEVNPGPVITRFEIKPAPGVKVSKISNLAKDLARSLAVLSVRVVEVIPGKSVVGIEIPNEEREMVRLSEVLNARVFQDSSSALTLALGNDIGGNPMVANLAKMPHLLVAGTTGSGKSVGVNAMILSMLLKATPEEVRFIMVDPKMLELSIYDGIPHLLAPVVTDMKDAANALRWCVAEMERRYRLLASLGVRNLAGYNRKVKDAAAAGEPLLDPTWKPDEYLADDEQERPELETLPFIVVVIDEFADMMMIVGKKVEELIARIAQKARAAGIHLILATQRPSVDVITGLIKANIPTRMSFQVSSKIDSRTVLDQGGAEQLLGHGDMLYLPPGSGLPVRVHGAFVDDDEVHRVVSAWKARGEPVYVDDVLNGAEGENLPGVPNLSEGGGDSEGDALFDEAVAFVTEGRRVSISSVQRKFKIGYNRAANLVDAMEASGVVSAAGHNGAREVLAPPPPRD
ncbi:MULTISPECIES: DNA translocase FtsK [Marinobacter]|uniref:DNA translocase FtsK n=1 Tax=Marinobacter salarius TaxID=1420917 RepID=A0ABY1FS45_9GAMM|nr:MULTISPECIES: DNA translocase FtsK [Marinobacter]KXJ48008.1 MAG: cell division protein FtsK [Marinobacter sp. Hex_13]SFL97211.1 DNA segregation ATPase FtsK/SpoIIIE, S-DNA-T family [Marinobacter salarius]|tara:strand:- start:8370 stop:10949 length:2580 start_codon:yes stop_codon:yes gene_type:complete